MKTVPLVILFAAILAPCTPAQVRRPAARPPRDRTERVLADSTMLPPSLVTTLRRLTAAGVESASLGFPQERDLLISAVIRKYGPPDTIRVAARGPSGPGLPAPQVDSLYIFGRLTLGVPRDGSTGRIQWVTLHAPPGNAQQARTLPVGERILADSTVVPIALRRTIVGEPTLLRPWGADSLTKVWHAIPAGQRPRLADIRRKYGPPDRIIDETSPALASGSMMSICRDAPDPAPAPTITLAVHYYGLVGLGVDRSSGDDAVRIITNLHSSARRR
jgi:hypothetical protein